LQALRQPTQADLLGLLAAFTTAKLATLLLVAWDGHLPSLPLSAALGLFADDAFTAVVLWPVLIGARHLWSPLAPVLLLLFASHAGANVAVTRVFFTPLTAAMLRASGTALADSVTPYLTPANGAGVVAPVLAALSVMRFASRPSTRLVLGLAALSLVFGAAGPALRATAPTLGLHHNALALALRSELSLHHGSSTRLTALPLPVEGEATDLSALSGAARGHNLLWVVLESTAAHALVPYGAARDAMPHVAQLAARGVVFDSVYAAYPESIKGLYALLCARAVAPNTPVEAYTQSASPCMSIAARLREQGYHTALFHSGRFAYLGMQGVVEERGFDMLADAAVIGGPHARSFGTDDAQTADRALAWLDTLPPDAHFFLLVLPIAGHHPYHAPGTGPRPFHESTERDAYDNDLFVADSAVALLLEGLRKRGHARDTLVAISGDHGEAFLEHAGNVAHSLFVYEENVHIPLLLAGDAVHTSQRATQIASSIDIVPTLLDVLGVPPLPAADGISALRSVPAAARFFADHATLRLGLRHGPWKFIYEPESERAQLFDLRVDPAERNDCSALQPWRSALYRRDLLTWARAGR
jgi:arylsulfatase A-like enzyme